MCVPEEVGRLVRELELAKPTCLEIGVVEALERLLERVTGLDRRALATLCRGAPRLAPLYGAYVKAKESEEARALLREGDGVSLAEGVGGKFAGDSYARVADLFDRVDFRACRELVMVGSGPLPVTLLHVADRTDVPRIVGLDVDEDAVQVAGRICERLGSTRIEVRVCDGRAHDYGGADVVYVANLITPKRAVLARIAETARPGTPVVVREPIGAGVLFAECGVPPSSRRLPAVGVGRGAPRFLSRHVFRVTQAGAGD